MNQPIIKPSTYDVYKINFNGRTWGALKDGFEIKLKELREQNESIRTGPEKTIEVRAKIAVYKELLGLRKP